MATGDLLELFHSKAITPVVRSRLFNLAYRKLALVAFDSGLKLSLGEVVVTHGAALRVPAEDMA